MTPEEKEDELALTTACIVADIKTSFGAFPVLRGEDASRYDRILFDVVRGYWPSDFIGRMLCRDIANAVWFELRFDRHTQFSYDNLLLEKIELQKKRLGQQGLIQTKPTDDEQFVGPSEPTGNELVRIDRAEEEEVPGQTFHELAGYWRVLDDLKSTNFYRRNVSLQLMREHRPRSVLPAYMVRKEHIQRAEADMAERDARIQSSLSNVSGMVSSVLANDAV
jgi:hypothetical protein